MILFIHLKLDTGYTIDGFQKFIERNGSNSGLEKSFTEEPYILKDPRSLNNFEEILKHVSPDFVIIPVRDYFKCAASVVKYWRLEKYDKLLEKYYRDISNYILLMVKNDIPTIFIDFDRMVDSKEYLFDKLKPMLNEITFVDFCDAYDKASLHQKNKKNEKILEWIAREKRDRLK